MFKFLFICLSDCLIVSFRVCLFVCLFICLFVCLYACLFVSLLVCLFDGFLPSFLSYLIATMCLLLNNLSVSPFYHWPHLLHRFLRYDEIWYYNFCSVNGGTRPGHEGEQVGHFSQVHNTYYIIIGSYSLVLHWCWSILNKSSSGKQKDCLKSWER